MLSLKHVTPKFKALHVKCKMWRSTTSEIQESVCVFMSVRYDETVFFVLTCHHEVNVVCTM